MTRAEWEKEGDDGVAWRWICVGMRVRSASLVMKKVYEEEGDSPWSARVTRAEDDFHVGNGVRKEIW